MRIKDFCSINSLPSNFHSHINTAFLSFGKSAIDENDVPNVFLDEQRHIVGAMRNVYEINQ